MSERFYVYVHRRPDTGMPFYVGKGKGDRSRRKTSRNRHWHAIVAKTGEPAIQFVATGLSEELAMLAEIELISKLRAIGIKLANATDGGDGVSGLKRKQGAAEIERRRIANTGKKRTPEQCARIAAAKAGHGVGRKQSAETVEKRIGPLRGKPRPDVSLNLGGKKRPIHVVEALKNANDVRYAERRERLTAAIIANPDLGAMALSRITGCDREMVSKYKRLHSTVEG